MGGGDGGEGAVSNEGRGVNVRGRWRRRGGSVGLFIWGIT